MPHSAEDPASNISMNDAPWQIEQDALQIALSHERDLNAKLMREINQERRRNDLIEADQADFIEKLKEIRRLQALAEDLLTENKQYKDLIAKAMGAGKPHGKMDVVKGLETYFTELTQARKDLVNRDRQHAADRQRYEADELELRERLEALKSELLRVQSANEQAYVLRSVYESVFERLKELEKEVEILRGQRMASIPLLLEREAILNSTTWKLTSAPRALITLLRRGKHD